MPARCPFLSVQMSAFAHATEVEERALQAVRFASQSEEVSVTRAEGHSGNPIAMLAVELRKARDIERFAQHAARWGIWSSLAPEAEARLDGERFFHFRLDKQRAYLGELALATGKDVIDVSMKVESYPAERGAALQVLSAWLAECACAAGR